MNLSKNSISRIGRKAGIKTMSIKCLPIIRNFIEGEIKCIMEKLNIICENNEKKVITENELILLLELYNKNLAFSSKIGTTVLGKK